MEGDRSSTEPKRSDARLTDKKKKPPSSKKNFNPRWIITLFFVTMAISMTMSFVANEALRGVGDIVAFCVLGFFILLGIVFDVIGVAVTAADEKPLNSMAARKVSGAREALALVRSADKVSSFCNDVVGDISGIISGATGAIIAARLVASFSLPNVIVSLLMSGMISALTVGGKAVGKSLAINYSTMIVHYAGRVVYFVKRPFTFGRHKHK